MCEPAGNILVFFTGEEEIEDACRKISKEVANMGDPVGSVKAVASYSTLPPAMQQKIFDEIGPNTEAVRNSVSNLTRFGKRANDDHERSILTKLKQQCGGIGDGSIQIWSIKPGWGKDVEACMTWEKDSGKPINVICLNVLALLGLLHLNKDRTFCTNDDNMNRECTSWLNTLHTITTKTMQNKILKQKEELCRITALPVGLAHTYGRAQVLGKRTNMLPPHLALRLDVSPPPVQRIMIVDSSQRD
ncbi:hypothetical protein RYX36_005386 [Vicia faba]